MDFNFFNNLSSNLIKCLLSKEKSISYLGVYFVVEFLSLFLLKALLFNLCLSKILITINIAFPLSH